jgi:hypothetical protein
LGGGGGGSFHKTVTELLVADIAAGNLLTAGNLVAAGDFPAAGDVAALGDMAVGVDPSGFATVVCSPSRFAAGVYVLVSPAVAASYVIREPSAILTLQFT